MTRTAAALSTAALFLAALAAACASEPMTDGAMMQSPVQRGRAIAQSECARCHAIRELGSSPREDAPPLRTVLNSYNPSRLEMSFQEGLLVGHPDMPVFVLSDEQIDDLLAYLQDIKE